MDCLNGGWIIQLNFSNRWTMNWRSRRIMQAMSWEQPCFTSKSDNIPLCTQSVHHFYFSLYVYMFGVFFWSFFRCYCCALLFKQISFGVHSLVWKLTHRVRAVFEGLGKFGENGISLSRPWKSVKTEWGLWKFVNFVDFRAPGETYQRISQKLHFPRPNSSFFLNRAKSQRTHFLSVLTDRVHQL